MSAVLVAGLVLVGWWFDVDILKNPAPQFPTMKANTALAFVLAGLALWLSRAASTNRWSRRVAQIPASIVVLIGLLALSEYLYEYLFGQDLGIDGLLLQERRNLVPHLNPGRMAFTSALSFLLLGSALLLLDVKTRSGYWPAEHVAVAVSSVAFLTLVAYLYGGVAIHQVYPFATVAPPTALLFLALSIGVVFARAQHRIVGVMTSDAAAAAAMRRLLVVAILLPILAGWIRLKGQQFGFFNTEFGLAIIVVFAIVALTGSIYWQATSLIQAEEYQRGINKVSALLSQSFMLEDVFPGVATVITTLVPCDRICVVVREGEKLVATLSFAEPSLKCFHGKTWHSSGKTAVEWVMDHKIPRLIRDLQHEQTFADEVFVAREGIRSTMILPLLVGGEAVGSITLDSRMPGAYTQDHVTILSNFMEPLASAVRNVQLYAQVVGYSQNLEDLVQERTRELQAANGHLADASRHKSNFLANMSHELRTPLNAILGFADLLCDQTVGPLTPKQARYANHIQTSGRHLLALINDLLDLSKVEAGKLTLRLESLALSEALAATVYEIRPVADAKRLTIVSDIDSAPITLTADPVRFKQIVLNLLSNAIKFTPEGGRVTVTARTPTPSFSKSPDYAEISVADTGIGIAAEDLPRLFERFRQLETTQQSQGSGLGLALTKQLVELHGGTMAAASAGPGHGSTFTVWLPLTPPASRDMGEER
ncbi:GAF domain-containing sensor histidine kinase [Candidatus Methylomirabilis sp.]|uniref:GAF domain-containing sensor histidine kinase n=1 Tax=Candidatus Methylomirabilis sp. TaxID=2032687 RepID=UPI002A5B736B|nr:GAF domain-containing sensor histidine kinase [Candidatus Methylomirabilis sp.]